VNPFDELAALAGLDAGAVTLERTKTTLPASRSLAKLDGDVAGIDRAVALIVQERAPLDATMQNLESEATRLAEREAQVNAKLATATGAGRELEAMDAEIRRIHELRLTLEDQEIELLEALEPLEARELELLHERKELLAARPALVAKVEADDAEVRHAIVENRAQRSEVAARIDEAVLARYEKISVRADGVGAARLEDGHCSGCHLSLPAVELDALKKAPLEELSYCEQCGRILLRPGQLD
jgi:uncharacterized protein